MAIEINNRPLDTFGCEAIGYRVGTHILSNLFVGLENSIRPIKLTESKSYRPFYITVEFFAASEAEAAMNQSNFTQYLLDNDLEIALPDGFTYTSVLASVGDIDRIADIIYVCEYGFAGFRHKDIVTIQNITVGRTITVDGNMCADAVLTITGSKTNTISLKHTDRAGNEVTETYEVDCSSTAVVIDGMKKTVKRNGANAYKSFARFTVFPRLKAGASSTQIAIKKASGGSVNLSISYYPTFA